MGWTKMGSLESKVRPRERLLRRNTLRRLLLYARSPGVEFRHELSSAHCERLGLG